MKDVWASFGAVTPAIASSAAVVLALLGSLWDPGVQIKIGLIWLVVVGLVVVAIVAASVKMAFEARRSGRGDPPRAVYVYIPAEMEPGTTAPVTLIMRRSSQFGVNILVTIYYEESLGVGRGELFERAIGFGRVVNIQENGLIQVLVLREVSTHSDLWARIRDREIGTLSHVLIKPSIDFNAVGIEVRFDERG